MKLNLNIASKLLIVTMALVFPIVTLLYLLVQEKNIAINFGTKESYGDQYIRPLRTIMANAPVQKVLIQRNRLMGERNSIDAQQAAVDTAFQELAKVDAAIGAAKGFSETADRLVKLKSKWDSVKTRSNNENFATSLDEFVTEVRGFYSHVGDVSNLILDPDLDSYYLMDVTLLKVPNLAENLYKLQALAEHVWATKQATAKEKTDLTVLAGLIASDAGALRYDHDTAYKNTKDGKIKEELEPNVAGTIAALQAYSAFIEKNILTSGSVQSSVAQSAPLALAASKKLFDMFDTTIVGEDRLLKTRVDAFIANRNFTVTWVGLVTLSFLILGAFFVLGIIRNVARLNAAAQTVTGGDLDVHVEIESHDELGTLGNSFNTMVSSIRDNTKKLEASQVSEQEREHLEQVVQELSKDIYSIQQASEIVTDNARIVAETASQASVISSEGELAVQESIQGVESIKHQIESVAAKILELSSQTQAIGNIIATVDEISKQSKFLAFNASIEASKVGEYGKGFAIVANEIKNLSEESKEATKKIGEILGEIQGLTNTSVMLAEDATKLADTGFQLSSTAGDTITKLALSIENASEAAFQITSSAMEQQDSLAQLLKSLQLTLGSRN